MSNESIPNDPRNAWQTQPAEPGHNLPANLPQRALVLRRTIFWRNLREYSGAALVVAIFAYYEWKLPFALIRAGSALIIAGALYMAYQLHRKGGSQPSPVDLARTAGLDFYRSELQRQRDLLLGVWSWYLLPFIPGLGIFLLGIAVAQANSRPAQTGLAFLVFGISVAAVALVFFLVWKLNRWAAGKLQHELEALISLDIS